MTDHFIGSFRQNPPSSAGCGSTRARPGPPSTRLRWATRSPRTPLGAAPTVIAVDPGPAASTPPETPAPGGMRWRIDVWGNLF